jgi:hypothetical protein
MGLIGKVLSMHPQTARAAGLEVGGYFIPPWLIPCPFPPLRCGWSNTIGPYIAGTLPFNIKRELKRHLKVYEWCRTVPDNCRLALRDQHARHSSSLRSALLALDNVRLWLVRKRKELEGGMIFVTGDPHPQRGDNSESPSAMNQKALVNDSKDTRQGKDVITSDLPPIICNAPIIICPTCKAVASYFIEGLSPEERQRIEQHFIGCRRCRMVRLRPIIHNTPLTRICDVFPVPLVCNLICKAPITLCPSSLLVLSYLAGVLEPERRRPIDEHLLQCSWCRAMLRAPIPICNAPVIPCPAGALMESYITGRLEPERRQPIEEHLIHCWWCRQKFILLLYTVLPDICPDSSLLDIGKSTAASVRRDSI